MLGPACTQRRFIVLRDRKIAWWASDRDVNFKPPLGEMAIEDASTEVSDDRVLTVKSGVMTLQLREDKPKDPLESWQAAILTHTAQYAGGFTGADL